MHLNSDRRARPRVVRRNASGHIRHGHNVSDSGSGGKTVALTAKCCSAKTTQVVTAAGSGLWARQATAPDPLKQEYGL